jgi:hypothetical protein
MIVEDHPEVETQRSEIPPARQRAGGEIASQTKQQIMNRERGKQ